jgi:hypothetical protein
LWDRSSMCKTQREKYTDGIHHLRLLRR